MIPPTLKSKIDALANTYLKVGRVDSEYDVETFKAGAAAMYELMKVEHDKLVEENKRLAMLLGYHTLTMDDNS